MLIYDLPLSEFSMVRYKLSALGYFFMMEDTLDPNLEN